MGNWWKGFAKFKIRNLVKTLYNEIERAIFWLLHNILKIIKTSKSKSKLYSYIMLSEKQN